MADPFLPESLLNQLSTFSRRVLEAERLPADGSPNGGSRPLSANGIILHYTAGESFLGALRWLCDPLSDASSHFVVAKERIDAFDALLSDLPAVAALPVTVLQLRPLDKEAYHATWTNSWAFGIEMCNAGELRPLSPDADAPWRPVSGCPMSTQTQVQNVGLRRFAALREGQLRATHALCRALSVIYHIPAHRILSHEMVQGQWTKARGANGHDKRDVGQLDMSKWRAVCQMPTPQMEAIGQGLLRYCAPAVQPADLPVLQYQDIAGGGSRQMLWQCCTWMRMLGYDAPDDSKFLDGYKIFQEMMGLNPDGICGPLTEAALRRRIMDRFGAPPVLLQPASVKA